MKIYAAMYNECIHESAYGVLSLHETKKGAEITIAFHKENERKKWMKIYSTKKEQKHMPFGQHEDWCVGEYDLQK